MSTPHSNSQPQGIVSIRGRSDTLAPAGFQRVMSPTLSWQLCRSCGGGLSGQTVVCISCVAEVHFECAVLTRDGRMCTACVDQRSREWAELRSAALAATSAARRVARSPRLVGSVVGATVAGTLRSTLQIGQGLSKGVRGRGKPRANLCISPGLNVASIRVWKTRLIRSKFLLRVLLSSQTLLLPRA